MNKKIVTGIVVVLVAAFFIYVGVSNNGKTGGKQVEVKFEKVKADKVTASITASGMIEEVNKKDVFAESPVKIDTVLLKKNQSVKKGQQVAVFDLSSFQSEVDRLENNRATQELTIKKLRIMNDPKGTISMESSVTLAQNSLKSAEEALKVAETTYTDNKTLYASGSISKSDLDRSERAVSESRSAYANAKASLSSAQSSLNDARKGNQTSSSSTGIDIQIQELNLNATEDLLKEAKDKLEKVRTAMYSPMDGVISESSLKDGIVAGGSMQSLYTVSDNENLQVRANVKEFDIKKVAVGQNVEFYGDAFDRSEGVSGKVVSVGSNAFKVRNGTSEDNVVEVIMEITKKVKVLRPGLGTTCIVFTEVKNGVPVLSLEAIAEDKNGDKYVFVIQEPAMTMKQTFIKLGIFSETVVEVTDGLKVGDSVILDPQPTYRDGVKVKATELSKK
jgi:HlyD family secretion protein